jgi:membrane-associated phospholipid phosphatase
MSESVGGQRPAVEEALAQRVAGHDRAGRWAEVLRELGAIDRAVYQAVAETPSPRLDVIFRRLSLAANHSRLWLGIGALMALFGGARGRRAALDGALAIGVTSATVNLGVKPLARRRRPERVEQGAFTHRYVSMPASTSFPSGHAASAFAFAYTVGRRMPGLALPVGLLAAGVAQSRVHTGVHYPSDVVIGAIVGAGTATLVTAAADHVRTAPGGRRT